MPDFVGFCRAIARNSSKETSIVYLFLVFFFVVSLVDDALIVTFFMSIYGHHNYKSTTSCRFISFVTIGNRLLQAFGVITLLYLSFALLKLKSKRIENQVRKFLPVIFVGLLIVEVIFALPAAFNTEASSSGRCQYINNAGTVAVGWLYYVILPYFLPLFICMYPFVRIAWIVKNPESCAERDRSQYQIVLSVAGGYFFFHFLYYLLWLGREIEALILDKSQFRQILGLHFWYIARPLFSLINLGWHIAAPLSPFIFDSDLVEEIPGPWINKNRMLLHSRSQPSEDIVLQERSTNAQNEEPSRVAVTKDTQWTEIHNPLPTSDSDYHQIPL